MNLDSRNYAPSKRINAFVRQLGSEFLIIDDDGNKSHCLNQSAGRVWMLCNGENTVAEIARILSEDTGSQVEVEFVWLALKELRNAKLLRAHPALPADLILASRRTLLRSMGMAATLAVPVVASIVVPHASAAGSCKAKGTICLSNAECCSNKCARLKKVCE
jgi:hypothetical protein